jgi:hypothetical protein
MTKDRGLYTDEHAKLNMANSVGKIDLRKITSVAEVSPDATEKWESANVHRG